MAAVSEKRPPRVRRLIDQTFLDLLKKKSFYDIKVSDIIQAADISRSAFYSHYEDKYDLMAKTQERFFDGLSVTFQTVREAGKGATLTLYSRTDAASLYGSYFHYLEANEELFHLLAGPNGDGRFLSNLADIINREQTITRAQWGVEDMLAPQYHDYLTNLLSYSYVGTFVKWLNDPSDTRPSPEEMGLLLSQLFTTLSGFSRDIDSY